MARKSDAAAPEPVVERPRNRIGVELADDGRPVFIESTGESRQQYLARLADDRLAERNAGFEASLAAIDERAKAEQAATTQPDKE